MTYASLHWPADRVPDALGALAEALDVRGRASHHASDLETTAARLGLEIEAVAVSPQDLASLGAAGPALWQAPDGSWLALDRARRGARLLTPEGPVRVGHASLRTLLVEAIAAEPREATRALLARAGIDDGPDGGLATRIVGEWLEPADCGRLWLVRRRPRDLRDDLRQSTLGRDAVGFVIAHAAQLALFVAAWWLIGVPALAGRIEPATIAGWSAVMAMLVALQVARGWYQARLALLGGATLKRLLLRGALGSDLDEATHAGPGDATSRVLDSESVENVVFSGGLLTATAVLDLVAATWVLTQGAAPVGMVIALWTGVIGAAVLTIRFIAIQRTWTAGRLRLSRRLVETLIGHRTRAVQGDPRSWHDEDDGDLGDYLSVSRTSDRHEAVLTSALPRTWTVLALGLLGVGMLSGAGMTSLVVSIGGMLLAQRALAALGAGVPPLVAGGVSLRNVWPLVRGAHRAPEHPLSLPRPTAAATAHVLESREVSYRYPGAWREGLGSIDLELSASDRILLTGDSGSGKSTLAAVLAGLRPPTTGQVRLRGLDLASRTGRAWRRAVALTPQFHQNHILSGTLAWNLLLARPRRTPMRMSPTRAPSATRSDSLPSWIACREDSSSTSETGAGSCPMARRSGSTWRDRSCSARMC